MIVPRNVEVAQGARQYIIGNIVCIWYGMHLFIKCIRLMRTIVLCNIINVLEIYTEKL